MPENLETKSPGSFKEFIVGQDNNLTEDQLIELYTGALIEFRKAVNHEADAVKLNAILADIAA